MDNNIVFNEWLDQPIPIMPENELALFIDRNSIDTQVVTAVKPSKVVETLRQKVGTKVIGIDLGGGSVRGGVFVVSGSGTLELTNDFTRSTEAEEGEGFLEQLEVFAYYAKRENLLVGMSYGGPIDGSLPRYHPKIPKLMDDLDRKYDGDFAKIFINPFAILNDGPAGLLRAVEKSISDGNPDPAVIYLINGGGLGVGVYKNGTLYSTEAGHIECVSELNRNKVTKPCGLYGDHVCMENVISNKQGFEDQWEKHTGQHRSGKQIEDMARARKKFALDLFEQAALVEATLISGVAKVFALDINSSEFSVVVHGGLHRTPNIQNRIAEILWQNPRPQKQIQFTEAFDPNACMHGAALFALSSK